MLTKEGQAKVFCFRTDKDFQDVYEMAENVEAHAEVLQAIRNRQMYPFTLTQKTYAKLQGDAWQNHVMPVKKIPERDWFYAITDRVEEVTSFNHYFSSIWPEP